jgi:hypothetical protein
VVVIISPLFTDYSGDCVSAPVRLVLDLCRIEHDGSLQSIVDATQKAWLIRDERGRMVNREQPTEIAMNKQLLELFRKACLTDDVRPGSFSANHLLVFGARHEVFMRRFEHAAKVCENNVEIGSLILLGSNRELRENEYSRNRSAKHSTDAEPLTESEMMRAVYEESGDGWIKNLEVQHVNAVVSGKTAPDTMDTLKRWLVNCPFRDQVNGEAPRTIIAVSSQPSLWYQKEVIDTAFDGTEVVVDITGPKTCGHTASEILGELAKALFQRLERVKRLTTATK